MTLPALRDVASLSSISARDYGEAVANDHDRRAELLRRVEAGETIEITDRGRPVALLSPMPEGGPYEQMLASGEVEPATLDLDELPEPLELEPGVELPSVTLARLREHER